MVRVSTSVLFTCGITSRLPGVTGNNLNTMNAQTKENMHKIICPFLSTLINEGVWPVKPEYTRKEIEAITEAAGISIKEVLDHSASNFDNSPTDMQDIWNMEGAHNEHVTSTGIHDCVTIFSDCKTLEDDREVCTTETPNPHCTLPNKAVFDEFVAKVDTNQDGYITHTELWDAEEKGTFPVVDANPWGKGSIVGSYDAIVRLFGETTESIKVVDLHRIFILRKFPQNGYFFGRKMPPFPSPGPSPKPYGPSSNPYMGSTPRPPPYGSMLSPRPSPLKDLPPYPTPTYDEEQPEAPLQPAPGSGWPIHNCHHECFPGHSLVRLATDIATMLSDLQVGEQVLVEDNYGVLRYQPVLTFLHQLRTDTQSHVVAVHRAGVFRATDSHIVFVVARNGHVQEKTAKELAVGDCLHVVSAAGVCMKIESIRRRYSDTGMFAPLTASGKVVVDGAVASSYASNALMIGKVSHGAMHASMFLMRSYVQLVEAARTQSSAMLQIRRVLGIQGSSHWSPAIKGPVATATS
eukprot:TRINITY_DN8535_c0_g1_i3.p1 TRINITY_DN8535_c0_g1~~TRINITY_DN8535_c0_g1_i3.p1  ORF type:complete len:520 (+),score=69.73 TRINITY_DN8535_c0_g1_i3:66-1625(+)